MSQDKIYVKIYVGNPSNLFCKETMMIFGSKGLQTKCEEVVNDKIVQQEFR
jgi:hypothetical protein